MVVVLAVQPSKALTGLLQSRMSSYNSSSDESERNLSSACGYRHVPCEVMHQRIFAYLYNRRAGGALARASLGVRDARMVLTDHHKTTGDELPSPTS
jgi:hypothetical protein